MSEITNKRRIFQVAKELNISHLEILDFLKNKGEGVSSLMAPVSQEIYDDILLEFSKDKQQSERYRKEQARKKVVSEIRKKHIEDVPVINKPSVPKIKTLIEKDDFTLSGKIKQASKKLKEDKAVEESLKQKNLLKANADKSKNNKEEIVDIKSETTKQTLESAEEINPKLDIDKKIIEKVNDETESKPRKLKKISIEDIADKINQSRKRPERTTGDSGKAKIKQKLQQYGKSSSRKKNKKKEKDSSVEPINIQNSIKVPEYTTIDELSRTMNVTVQDVIKASIGLGMMVTINQRMDMDNIIMIADEFGFEVETIKEYAEEEIAYKDTKEDIKNAVERAPVVTIMGHVDHGKTSLLDFIRESNVVAGESGGITQHIGAYEVELNNGKGITFLDTPGHAAFTAMRARGAQVTDIVIVIIAADDDVKPQTREAIDHAKAADVPIIIAINKIDLPNANTENIKKTLSEMNILVEDWGGKYQCQEISSKSGEGIKELLEKIILEAEVLELKANRETEAHGVVIESRLDKGLGAIATVLIRKGTLKKGNSFLCGKQFGKVRGMFNERSIKLENAFPSDPIQILGFEDVPNAGDVFTVFTDEREAKKIATKRAHLAREAEQRRFRNITLDQIGKKISIGEINELGIIIKGDVDGSIEAISDSLMNLTTTEVAVKIIHRSVGMITENDVTLAAASNAIIVAFNVNASPEAKTLSKSIGVDIRSYAIIYEAIQEIKLALEGLLRPEVIEKALGFAEVREQFKIPKIGIIAGCYITKGKVVRNAMLRVRRAEEIIHEGKLTSLKRFKDDTSEVLENYECGIGVDGFHSFIENDIIEVYEIKEIKRTLS